MQKILSKYLMSRHEISGIIYNINMASRVTENAAIFKYLETTLNFEIVSSGDSSMGLHERPCIQPNREYDG
jgi:protein associated with RNAse G/E